MNFRLRDGATLEVKEAGLWLDGCQVEFITGGTLGQKSRWGLYVFLYSTSIYLLQTKALDTWLLQNTPVIFSV